MALDFSTRINPMDNYFAKIANGIQEDTFKNFKANKEKPTEGNLKKELIYNLQRYLANNAFVLQQQGNELKPKVWFSNMKLSRKKAILAYAALQAAQHTNINVHDIRDWIYKASQFVATEHLHKVRSKGGIHQTTRKSASLERKAGVKRTGSMNLATSIPTAEDFSRLYPANSFFVDANRRSSFQGQMDTALSKFIQVVNASSQLQSITPTATLPDNHWTLGEEWRTINIAEQMSSLDSRDAALIGNNETNLYQALKNYLTKDNAETATANQKHSKPVSLFFSIKRHFSSMPLAREKAQIALLAMQALEKGVKTPEVLTWMSEASQTVRVRHLKTSHITGPGTMITNHLIRGTGRLERRAGLHNEPKQALAINLIKGTAKLPSNCRTRYFDKSEFVIGAQSASSAIAAITA